MARVLYPGTFDPLHNGHLDIITTASAVFDSVVIAAMRNPSKSTPMFDQAERMRLIKDSTAHLDNIEVVGLEGLVVDAARDAKADLIVKGLRGVVDFDTELQMAQMNQHVSGVVTVFLPSDPAQAFIASKYIREISKMGGDVSDLVPGPVAAALDAKATSGGRSKP